MYNIWFCKIISKDTSEKSKIGGLEYIKLMYEEIEKEDLQKYAMSLCKDLKYIYGGIIDERYVLFKNDSNYCLFFEELLENEVI